MNALIGFIKCPLKILFICFGVVVVFFFFFFFFFVFYWGGCVVVFLCVVVVVVVVFVFFVIVFLFLFSGLLLLLLLLLLLFVRIFLFLVRACVRACLRVCMSNHIFRKHDSFWESTEIKAIQNFAPSRENGFSGLRSPRVAHLPYQSVYSACSIIVYSILYRQTTKAQR